MSSTSKDEVSVEDVYEVDNYLIVKKLNIDFYKVTLTVVSLLGETEESRTVIENGSYGWHW